MARHQTTERKYIREHTNLPKESTHEHTNLKAHLLTSRKTYSAESAPPMVSSSERHNTSWGDAQQCCAQLVVESSSSAENSPVRAEQTAHRFAQYKAGPLALACKRCRLSQHVHSPPLAVVGRWRRRCAAVCSPLAGTPRTQFPMSAVLDSR